jgi:Tfp pilus assembly protein PilO
LGAFGFRRSSKTLFDNVFQVKYVNRYLRIQIMSIQSMVRLTPQEDDLDQEIINMEMLHQQVQRKKEKMARLADLQRQIDEAFEEVRHLTQDEQNRRPQHRELH